MPGEEIPRSKNVVDWLELHGLTKTPLAEWLAMAPDDPWDPDADPDDPSSGPCHEFYFRSGPLHKQGFPRDKEWELVLLMRTFAALEDGDLPHDDWETSGGMAAWNEHVGRLPRDLVRRHHEALLRTFMAGWASGRP